MGFIICFSFCDISFSGGEKEILHSVKFLRVDDLVSPVFALSYCVVLLFRN